MTQDTLKHALLAARPDLEDKLAGADTPAEQHATEKELDALKIVADRLFGDIETRCDRILEKAFGLTKRRKRNGNGL
jgi:hypothetical protein